MNFLTVVAGVLPAPMQLARPPLQWIRLRSIALFVSLALSLTASNSQAAETIPPKPERYFNDYAKVVSPSLGQILNERLAQFERDTSNQVVVAVYRHMESDSSIEDYTQRVAQNWGVGQKEKKNGAVLFAFIDDRKMYIQTGYGLEGVLPDIICFDIVNNIIRPKFRVGDYASGFTDGIEAIIKATRGEYKGSGRTNKEKQSGSGGNAFALFVILAILFFMFSNLFFRRRRRGYSFTGGGGPFIGGWSGGGGGWSGGGGGGFSGFSGGGGSFGGGGAGGSW